MSTLLSNTWLPFAVSAISGLFFLYVIRYRYPTIRKLTKSGMTVVRPPSLPILGNLLNLGPDNILEYLHKTRCRFASEVMELQALHKRLVVISDLALGREMLMSRPHTFRRPTTFDRLIKLLNFRTSIFFARGEQWNRSKKLTLPAFNKVNIFSHFFDIWRISDSWANELLAKSNPSSLTSPVAINVKGESLLHALRCVNCIAFQADDESLLHYFNSPQFVQDIHLMLKVSYLSLIFPLPYSLWKYIFRRDYLSEVRDANDRMTEAANRFISHKRTELAKQEAKGIESRSYTLVETLLRKQQQLIKQTEASGVRDEHSLAQMDEEVAVNIKFFYIGGTETTGNAINFVLYYLCLYPQYYRTLQEEAGRFYSKYANELGAMHKQRNSEEMEALMRDLAFANAIVKETLRLCGPTPVIFLAVEGDKKLTLSNGYVVDPSDEIIINCDSMQKDPKHFTDPLAFNPYRWIDSDVETLAKMNEAFLPFGCGPKGCPGELLSMLEVMITIVSIAHHTEMALACDPKDIGRTLQFTTTVKHMPIVFTKR